MLVFLFIGFVWFLVQHASSVSILEFGAVPYRENNDACHANTQALESAFLHANSSLVDRTVKVPTGLTFCIFAAEISHMHKVTLQLDGVLVISKNQTEWRKGVVDFTAALNFLECRGLTLQGEGGVDGQGYGWWWNAILDPANGKRPHMLWIYGSQDVVVRDLYFHNSPNFHCRIYDVQHLHIQNITIHVNVTAQREISQHFGMWYEPAELEGRVGLPTFPLNTDGIDVNGNDILIEDSSIQNFDDAIVVKPNDETSYWGVCAENVFVRNIKVTFGVGMSIGSIGPGTTNPCIRNVTFENIDFDAPLKGVYIKTNPGDQGQGSVSDITYRNLTMRGALWYPIWIGPQQMHQPGEEGTGCSFLYPIVDQCPTQPRITLRNIKLENVIAADSLLMPGVILGDATNPIQNLTFSNVLGSGRNIVQSEYICQGVVNGSFYDSLPVPLCA